MVSHQVLLNVLDKGESYRWVPALCQLSPNQCLEIPYFNLSSELSRAERHRSRKEDKRKNKIQMTVSRKNEKESTLCTLKEGKAQVAQPILSQIKRDLGGRGAELTLIPLATDKNRPWRQPTLRNAPSRPFPACFQRATVSELRFSDLPDYLYIPYRETTK